VRILNITSSVPKMLGTATVAVPAVPCEITPFCIMTGNEPSREKFDRDEEDILSLFIITTKIIFSLNVA
jgi:hypothetical protein